LIIGQNKNQTLVQWFDASCEVGGGTAYATVDLQIDNPALTIPTHDANQLQQFSDRNPAAPNQAERSGGRGRFKDLVVRTDHDASGRQHRKHLGNASRNHRLRDIERRSGLCLSVPQRSPGEQHTDPYADDDRHNADPNRVHRKIVGV
jgi:hypothetical protein